MSLWKYKYFVDVVDSKSFTKAGKKNFVTQTAISQQISSLEKSIGGTLIERGNGELVVTELGEIVYERAKQILEINEEMTREIEHQKEAQVIRIGIDNSINKLFWWKMQEMIDEFYDEKDFRFSKLDAFIGSKMLENHTLDIYIGYEFHKTDKKVKIAEKSVCANSVGVFLGKNAPVQDGGTISVKDLKKYTKYAAETYNCSPENGNAKVVSNLDTMRIKVDFNNGYAFADSKYFSFCDGKMCFLSDSDRKCVIKAFYREGHGSKKIKDVLEKIEIMINE